MKLEIAKAASNGAGVSPAPVPVPVITPVREVAQAITPTPAPAPAPAPTPEPAKVIDPRALPGVAIDGLDPILEAAVNSQPVLPPKPAKTEKPEPAPKFKSTSTRVTPAGAHWKTYGLMALGAVVTVGVAVVTQGRTPGVPINIPTGGISEPTGPGPEPSFSPTASAGVPGVGPDNIFR